MRRADAVPAAWAVHRPGRRLPVHVRGGAARRAVVRRPQLLDAADGLRDPQVSERRDVLADAGGGGAGPARTRLPVRVCARVQRRALSTADDGGVRPRPGRADGGLGRRRGAPLPHVAARRRAGGGGAAWGRVRVDAASGRRRGVGGGARRGGGGAARPRERPA